MSALGQKQTSDRFDPADWAEAIQNGGYWSSSLASFVPVRDMTAEEVTEWEEKQEEELIERVMGQHPGMTWKEAIEALREAGRGAGGDTPYAFMTHIGKELRFVLARDFKLPALVLDFVEQSAKSF